MQTPIESGSHSLKLKWHIRWNHKNARNESSALKGPVKIVASTTLLINFLLQAACRCKVLA
ncbi:unnamed protein product, partial [Onchocerca ochengi]|uniref:Uncharacterized protein n=1 Tax=Onchocerca ochengi TaxID=42157 RepID=A0A182EM68_ONCOC